MKEKQEEVGDITKMHAKYRTRQSEIEISAISDILVAIESYDDYFKMYLQALKDLQSIGNKIGLHSASTFYGTIKESIRRNKCSQLVAVLCS